MSRRSRLNRVLGRTAMHLARYSEWLQRHWPTLGLSWFGNPVRTLIDRQLRVAGLSHPYTTDCYNDVTLARLIDWPTYAARYGLTDKAVAAEHYAIHRPVFDAKAGIHFDPQAYLAANPDVVARRRDPLRHFLLHAEREGRIAAQPLALPVEPRLDYLLRCEGRVQSGTVCVIVPVHNAREHTLRCLARVLSAKSALQHRVLVVDDASTDQALVKALDDLAVHQRIGLLRLPTNHGFSGAVNAGLAALADGEDAVLLNSDTEVYDHWIDRLHAIAHANPDIGTVTPLTNSGTILSYPIHLRDNSQSLERPWSEIDALAESLNLPPVEIPTAVGFCMYIRKDCLIATGSLDADAFPRGYGEENDFCLRAAALGWRHMAATNTFVFHAGSASFGQEKVRLIQAGLAVLDQRYPDYNAKIGAFIAQDPLFPARLALDCARVVSLAPERQVAHWTDQAPKGFRDSDIRLTIDAVDGAITLSCNGAPCTPALTDMLLTDIILPYDEPTAHHALTLLAPAVLDLRDGENVGAGHLAKVLKAIRNQRAVQDC